MVRLAPAATAIACFFLGVALHASPARQQPAAGRQQASADRADRADTAARASTTPAVADRAETAAAPLDPRGFKVYSIGPPTAEEKRHQYLWRFWTHIPAAGELVIFDRSWYGRVLVERVEGFCSVAEWQRAYDEINAFEKQLTDAGVLVLKFWLHTSAKEQLRRFREREENPLKSWKIGPDDWRNRNKRPQYLEAVEEMLRKTDTKHCPWRLIAAEHKGYGRVAVLKTVVEELEAVLGKHRAEPVESPEDPTNRGKAGKAPARG